MIMASYLDKAQINTAITENTKLDLGHQHITTADFMQNNVAYIHEMVPGEKIDVNMESFARLNPLPVPTFGRASMRNRAYFVPFRTIFRGWNDFITDAPHIWSDTKQNSAILTSVPTIQNSVLASMFLQAMAQDINSIQAGNLTYDTGFTSATDGAWDVYDGQKYLNFTQEGRQYLKVIESLGYKINWDTSDNKVYSALPLLAIGKLACDWYYPQPYTGTAEYNNVLRLCNMDTGVPSLTGTDVYNILKLAAYVQYDSDYFVSAFDLPNEPVASAHSDFKLVNLDTVGSYRVNVSSLYSDVEAGYVTNNTGQAQVDNRIGGANAPFITPQISVLTGGSVSSSQATPISEYLLHALHAMTDYMKRHQLAGSRAFDRYLARFGKALPAEKMNRSNYLGAAMQDIQIGDIMSTSDTQGAQLGAYAGKGMTYGNGHFEFSTDEFGYFIILSSIVPAAGYFQGVDRQVMRTTKLSFWTPEYDSLGNQPITADELYISPGSQNSVGAFNTALHDQIFGFTPRYADYKVAHDSLTGNFRINSLNGYNGQGPQANLGFNAADSWHLMRTFDDEDFSIGNTMYPSAVVHSVNFMKSIDWEQYKRIFYADGGVDPEELPDNFTVIHNFEIAAYAPMKALYDTYEFEDKGKKVTLDVNGVKMN